MVRERGVVVDRISIYRGCSTAKLEKKCRPQLKFSNDSYRVNETYLKVKGRWKHLYPPVDLAGNTIDFLPCAKRDAKAAARFFRKALKTHRNASPRVINVETLPSRPCSMENKCPNAASCTPTNI